VAWFRACDVRRTPVRLCFPVPTRTPRDDSFTRHEPASAPIPARASISAGAFPRLPIDKEKDMSTAVPGQAYHNNMVGPVMRAGDLAMAVIEAARTDNPGKEIFVDDKRAYIRIHAEQEMILRQATIEEELGRPFRMNDLEVDLSSFAGQIESRDDSVRFFFNKKL
jgi:toluene monooxygenase system protein D